MQVNEPNTSIQIYLKNILFFITLFNNIRIDIVIL